MADDELANKLRRRTDIIDGNDNIKPLSTAVFNPYTEFKEFSRKEIKDFEKIFKKYDLDNNKFIDLQEMKLMMEKLGAPQTHIGLKNMIAEVDEDNDGQVSFREFLLIFRKAKLGELDESSGLFSLANLAEVDVGEVGVKGAADFFKSKIDEQSNVCKFEDEIRQEQEERRLQEEVAKERKQSFQATKDLFNLS